MPAPGQNHRTLDRPSGLGPYDHLYICLLELFSALRPVASPRPLGLAGGVPSPRSGRRVRTGWRRRRGPHQREDLAHGERLRRAPRHREPVRAARRVPPRTSSRSPSGSRAGSTWPTCTHRRRQRAGSAARCGRPAETFFNMDNLRTHDTYRKKIHSGNSQHCTAFSALSFSELQLKMTIWQSHHYKLPINLRKYFQQGARQLNDTLVGNI